MKKEIEKLSLTVGQYYTLGIMMMVMCIVFSVVTFFVADYSVLTGIVIAVVAAETGFIGYGFCKVADELSESKDPEILARHNPSAKSRKNYTAVSAFVAILFVACACSAAVVIGLDSIKNVTGEQNRMVVQTQNIQPVTQIVEQSENKGSAASDLNKTPAVVYATQSGKRYHYSASCAGKNSFAITIEEAKNHSLTPCATCTTK